MQIEQINLQYNRLEDRLIVRIGISGHKELRFFMTRLLTVELLKIIGSQRSDAGTRFAEKIGAPSLDPQTAREFADQQAMSGVSMEKPYEGAGREPVFGERLPLISGLSWGRQDDVTTFTFKTVTGEQFTLNCNASLLVGFEQLLRRLSVQANWAVEASTAVPSAATPQAPAAPAPPSLH
jgi:hypothetical protein